MFLANAIRCQQHVDGRANVSSHRAQPAIVVRGFNGKRGIVQFDRLELHQLRLDECGFAIVTQALENFRQDRRGQADAFAIEVEIEPLGFGVGDPVKEIDPDRGVDDDQSGFGLAAHGVEVAFPFDLAAQGANPGLAPHLDQQAQAFLDGGLLGGRSRTAHRLIHQLVVYDDVRAHDVYNITINVYVRKLLRQQGLVGHLVVSLRQA